MLAQKYAEGGDLLRALHKAGGRLTEKSAVQMVIHPLLSCLVYLHSKGITHRQVSFSERCCTCSSNLMMLNARVWSL